MKNAKKFRKSTVQKCAMIIVTDYSDLYRKEISLFCDKWTQTLGRRGGFWLDISKAVQLIFYQTF